METIWKYFKSKGFSDCGIAGLMGNLYAESGFDPTNLQDSFEKKLGMNNKQYTAAVDNGSYKNFVHDGAGYGLAQWTFWSLKQDLLNYAQKHSKSIGDLNTQLDFLYEELASSLPQVVKILKNTQNIKEASNAVLLQFERPADQGAGTQALRASYGQKFYDLYHEKEEKREMAYTNSSLATYTRISPNRTSPRLNKIDTITIHCIVGQWTARQGCDYFANPGRGASANYIVGKDGSIGLCVPESDRAWTTGGNKSVLGRTGKMNDHRAITIETASDTFHPYWATDAAINALIDLCTDICKRNGKNKLLWFGDAVKTVQYQPKSNEMLMTVHRWFDARVCPGDYLYSKQAYIAQEVNKRLNQQQSNEEEEEMTQEQFNKMADTYFKELAKKPATWEQPYMDWAQKNSVYAGDTSGNLMPKAYITRGEAATAFKRLVEMMQKE